MKWNNIDTAAVTLDMLPVEGRDIAGIIGVENYIRLVMEYGGRSVYIHKLDAVKRLVRDDRIRSEFNGENHAALCKKYDLSEKQIRQILSSHPSQQLSLFDQVE